jgi:hypothetical protein
MRCSLSRWGQRTLRRWGKRRSSSRWGVGKGSASCPFSNAVRGRLRPMPANLRISYGYLLRGSHRCSPSAPNSRSWWGHVVDVDGS